MQIIVNQDKCIQCGICIKACSRNLIKILKQKIKVDSSLCNQCGHCFASCPSKAIEIKNGYIEKMEEFDEKKVFLDPEEFLYFQKFRRSIRHYKDKPVEEEKLNLILQAGRFSPTASNGQKNRYIVIEKNLDEIREKSLLALKNLAEKIEANDKNMAYYKLAWESMYQEFKEENIDPLFFHAPQVILIVSDDTSGYEEVNAGIAASRMELQANALGLGVCYIGFFQEACRQSQEVRDLLGLKEGEKNLVTFVLGYPSIEYKRTVARKPLNVSYI